MFFSEAQKVQAQALPAANFVVNRAVSGIVTKSLIKRGFAVNDPRYGATLAGVSKSMSSVNTAGAVAGVALTIAGAPVWLTVAAGLGIMLAGAAIVAGTTKVSIENNKLVVINDSYQNATPPDYPPVNIGADNTYANYSGHGNYIYRGSGCMDGDDCFQFPPAPSREALISYPIGSQAGFRNPVVTHWNLNDFKQNYFISGSYKPGQPYQVQEAGKVYQYRYDWEVAPNPVYIGQSNEIERLVGKIKWSKTCVDGDCVKGAVNSGYIDWDSKSAGLKIANPKNNNFEFPNLDTASAQLPQATKAQPLSDASLAQLSNDAWRLAASDPNYKGYPYSVTDPISPADVATWNAENPGMQPTLGDMLRPATFPNSDFIPLVNPATTSSDIKLSPYDVANVNVVNTPRLDLGADPNVLMNLEPIPTVPSIVSPLLNIAPGLKNYVVPNHSSVCPFAQFDIFGKTYSLNHHCQLLNDNRQYIVSIMYAVYVLAGLVIVLGA